MIVKFHDAKLQLSWELQPTRFSIVFSTLRETFVDLSTATPLPLFPSLSSPHAQVIAQIAIVLQEIRTRRHVLNLPARQLDSQEVSAAKRDVLTGGDVTAISYQPLVTLENIPTLPLIFSLESIPVILHLSPAQSQNTDTQKKEKQDIPPIPYLIRSGHILLPSQRDPIASMECKHNIILHITDPTTAVGAQRNGVIELLI